MQRQILGVLALVLLIAGVAFSVGGEERQDVAGLCVRIGLILGALWLALPELTRPGARWLFVAIIVFAFVLAKFPKMTIYAAILLVALAVLRPRIAAYADRRRL